MHSLQAQGIAILGLQRLQLEGQGETLPHRHCQPGADACLRNQSEA